MADQLLVTRDTRNVVTLTLNRPEARNALSLALNQAIDDAVADLAADRHVRAVVITGAGDKAFSAGADLKERKGVSAAETAPYVNAIEGAIRRVAELRCPTIAALNGVAFGGGMELALACDFRLAATTATMGLTEVRLGIMPGAGGTVRLPRLIGEAKAKELILTGRRVTAAQAHALGLVNQVVEPTALAAAVAALLEELLQCAPLSQVSAKSAIERGLEVGVMEALAIERECYDVTLFSDDRNEGLAAFAEGRAPVFRGD